MPRHAAIEPAAPAPLQVAAMDGNAAAATRLLQRAARSGTLEQVLLHQDQDGDMMTALSWAVWKGHQQVAELLLRHMPERQVLMACTHDCIPLYSAAKLGHAGLCRQLLRFVPRSQVTHFKNNEPTSTCPYRDHVTPLMAACSQGHAEVVKVLLEHIPATQVLQQNYLGDSALLQAVDNDYPEVVDVLLQYEPERQIRLKTQDGTTALHMAAHAGYTRTVQQLLAACDPQYQVLQELDRIIPLHIACSHGLLDVARLLLEHCPQQQLAARDALGMTPLMHAASSGHVSTMRLLLGCAGAGAADLLRQVDRYGCTPLMLAVMEGCLPAVQLLLEQEQADPVWQVQQVDWEGYNPLMLALRESSPSHISIARELLKHCPAQQLAMSTRMEGRTPLYFAVAAAAVGLVREMIRHITDPAALTLGLMGATTDCPTDDDASFNRAQRRCCRLLLAAGADPTTLTASQRVDLWDAPPSVQQLVQDARDRLLMERWQAHNERAEAEQALAAPQVQEEEGRAMTQAAQAAQAAQGQGPADKDKKRQNETGKGSSSKERKAAQKKTGKGSSSKKRKAAG